MRTTGIVKGYQMPARYLVVRHARFYALRLRENGAIKKTPQQIIADNTDWRFFDELKRELKM